MFGGQLKFLCNCKGILRPEPLTQTPQKGVPGEGQISTGSFGPLSGNGQSVSDLELVPDLSRVDPSKCEPSIYIAPVLNISTQTIEKKMAALNRQVQLLGEQVQILTSNREEVPPQCQGEYVQFTAVSFNLSSILFLCQCVYTEDMQIVFCGVCFSS